MTSANQTNTIDRVRAIEGIFTVASFGTIIVESEVIFPEVGLFVPGDTETRAIVLYPDIDGDHLDFNVGCVDEFGAVDDRFVVHCESAGTPTNTALQVPGFTGQILPGTVTSALGVVSYDTSGNLAPMTFTQLLTAIDCLDLNVEDLLAETISMGPCSLPYSISTSDSPGVIYFERPFEGTTTGGPLTSIPFWTFDLSNVATDHAYKIEICMSIFADVAGTLNAHNATISYWITFDASVDEYSFRKFDQKTSVIPTGGVFDGMDIMLAINGDTSLVDDDVSGNTLAFTADRTSGGDTFADGTVFAGTVKVTRCPYDT